MTTVPPQLKWIIATPQNSAELRVGESSERQMEEWKDSVEFKICGDLHCKDCYRATLPTQYDPVADARQGQQRKQAVSDGGVE